jgi:hypothetical protein
MPASTPVEILRFSPAASLWTTVFGRVADEYRRRPLDPPLWIVADGRHRTAAELALFEALQRKGLTTVNLRTIASLAAEILEIPQQTAVASPLIGITILTRILEEDTPDSLRESSAKPNFAQSFWNTLIKVESRGFLPDHPLENPEGPEPSADFSHLQRRIHRKLAERGLFTPGAMLRLATLRLQEKKGKSAYSAPWFIGPLLNVSALDRDFIRTLLAYAERAYLIPGFGVEPTELAAVQPGAAEAPPAYDFEAALQSRKIHFLRPATPESEINFIFATIAAWAADSGYRYSDFRIVHPFLEEFLPRLRSAAHRYRVPIRIHSSVPLGQSPAVILVLKMLDFFESRWDRAGMMELLKTRWLGEDVTEKSRLIEEILKAPCRPGEPPWSEWLKLARKFSAYKTVRRLEEWRRWDEQSTGVQTGAVFSRMIESMTESIEKFWSSSYDAIDAAASDSSTSAADLQSLREIAVEIGRYLSAPMSRAEWIRSLRRGIQVCAGNCPDPHTDGVEVISASREDHLPVRVVIYPALNSRVPSPERVNPFLNAAVQDLYSRHLRLFQQHALNARETLIFSCPQYGDDGDPLAISPFLISVKSDPADSAELLHQAESWKPHHLLKGDIPEITVPCEPRTSLKVTRAFPIGFLRGSVKRWSPSQLDRAVQCLFLHFAADILYIRPQEDELREATTPSLMGRIAHKALENYLKAIREGQEFPLEAWTREEFKNVTERFDPHLEIDRAGEELIRCLLDFAERRWETLANGFTPAHLELKFQPGSDPPAVRLDVVVGDVAVGTVEVEGRIDRLDVSQNREAIIIDYKYKKSESESKTAFIREVKGGIQTQLPLYWMAVEKLLNLKPVAMLQIYLRSGKIRGFKLKGAPELPAGTSKSMELENIDESEYKEILTAAIKTLEEKSGAIYSGLITPAPRNSNLCGPGRCAYADLCRYRGDRWKHEGSIH